jgi:TATA-binding protein-associated factor
LFSLQDRDDDVRAVAASILLPIAESFVQLSPHNIPQVVSVLWDCLKDLKDDLTSSTGNVMDLLGRESSCMVPFDCFLLIADEC